MMGYVSLVFESMRSGGSKESDPPPGRWIADLKGKRVSTCPRTSAMFRFHGLGDDRTLGTPTSNSWTALVRIYP